MLAGMTLAHRIVGNAMQMIICDLVPGQQVYCEAGKFLFKSQNVSMETRIGGPPRPGQAAQSGGRRFLSAAIDAGKRKLAGESFAFVWFGCTPPMGYDTLLAFAGVIPGEMRALEVRPGMTWFAGKDAFVAAEGTVTFDVAFSGLRQGMAGGEGFILEKFTGDGTVFIGGAGNFIDLNPADFGGTIQVDTGCIVAFDQNIRYDVQLVGGLNRQGLMNAVFGGEGLTLATLTGNGTVILQSMTMNGLSKAIVKDARQPEGSRMGPLGGLLSGGDD